MAVWLARRVATAAITFLLLTFVLHAAVRWIPGEPLTGDQPAEAIGDAAAGRGVPGGHGVDEGYAAWLGRAVTGNLGTSITVAPGRPVADLVGDALPWSLWLGGLAMAITFAVAVPLAALAARAAMAARPGARLGSLAGSAALFLLQALPVFWIALVLQHVLAARLGWLPLMGPGPAREGADVWPGAFSHWALPGASLVLGSLALAIRQGREALEGAARSMAGRAVRARGASELRLLFTHGLSRAAVPLVSLAALLLPGLVSGSVLVESIFALPGAGRLLYLAAGRRDTPLLLALSLLTAAATLAASVIADAAYRLVDPRTAGGHEKVSG